MIRPDLLPLIGRYGELHRLLVSLRHARHGHAAVAVVSGAAGLGTSRLTGEVLARARAEGFRTLQGAAGPLQRDLSYAPVVEALRPVLRGRDPEVATLVDGLSDLGRLVDGLPVAPPLPLTDPGLVRTRLCESVCTLLGRVADRHPVALLLDDLQWADPSSLCLLHYLVRALADRPLLLLLGHRAGEETGELRAALAALRRTSRCTEVVLAPLDPQSVRRLTTALLAGEPPPALLELVAARAGGAPLFVAALVDALVQDRVLVRSGGHWTLDPDAAPTVPPVVADLLAERLAALPAEARVVLGTIAGRDAASYRALRTVLDEGVVLIGITALCDAGLVHPEESPGGPVYRIAQPLLAEFAARELPTPVERAARPVPPRRAGVLSTREEEVARLVALGMSNAAVAGRLFISQRTVTTHLQNIYARLELCSRTELAHYVHTRMPEPAT